MAQIELDYYDTIRKADRLEELSRKLRAIAERSVYSGLSAIDSTWSGTAADLYKKKTRIYAEQLLSQAKELEQLAKGIRSSAERLKRVDETFSTIFGR